MSAHKERKHRRAEDEANEIAEQSAEDRAEVSPEYSPEGYDALLAERDELRAKYQRALADYQNAQRRFSADMAAAREAGVERVLSSLIPVLDHFDLALAQDTSKVGAAQMVAGVKMIRDEFSRAMSAFGVALISPALNDEFDPSRHEALSQLAAEGVAPGRISSVYQVGYRINDRVIRAAKVTLAPPAPEPPAEAPG